MACILGGVAALGLPMGFGWGAAAETDVSCAWTIQGPEGGNAWDLAVAPSDRSTVYAPFNKGIVKRLIKTTNAGRSWRDLGHLGFRFGVETVEVHPRRTGTVLAGAEEGISMSEDGGRSWKRVARPSFGDRPVADLAFAPSAPAVAYAAAGHAILKSNNGGRSWRKAAGSTGIVATSVVVDPIDSNIVYAGTGFGGTRGIVKSTDGGRTWRVANKGLRRNAVYELVIGPRSRSTLYAATISGLYRSEDAGASWTPLGLPVRIEAVAVARRSPETVFAATVPATRDESASVVVSTDGGATWPSLRQGRGPLDVTSLALGPGGRVLYAATAGGGVAVCDLSYGG